MASSRSTPQAKRISRAPQRKVAAHAPLARYYMGLAECPQCGRLGANHTRDCPHNLGPRDGS